MPLPVSFRQAVLIGCVLALGLGYMPGWINSTVKFALYRAPYMLVSACSIPPPPPHSLKAAILNVTKDFDQLSQLIQEFLRSPGVDSTVERQFRAFLAERAVRSNPTLESSLDWILSLYKFAFPFLLISLVAKLSGSPPAAAEHEGVPLPRKSSLPTRYASGKPELARDISGGAAEKLRQAPDLRLHKFKARNNIPGSPGTPDVASTTTFKSALSGLSSRE